MLCCNELNEEAEEAIWLKRPNSLERSGDNSAFGILSSI